MDSQNSGGDEESMQGDTFSETKSPFQKALKTN